MNTFTSDLKSKIRHKLKTDNTKAKESGTHINGLKCPACGKNEAFAYNGIALWLLCATATTNAALLRPLGRFTRNYGKTWQNDTLRHLQIKTQQQELTLNHAV